MRSDHTCVVSERLKVVAEVYYVVYTVNAVHTAKHIYTTESV
jgi:hypothetical protein